MRTKVRTMKGIKGSLWEDAMVVTYCPSFSYKQILEELEDGDVIQKCCCKSNRVNDEQPRPRQDWKKPEEVNEWKMPLISCADCKNPNIWCGPDCCWPCCIGQNVAYRLDECCCVPYCGGTTSMRVKVRTMYAIKGSLCGDCWTAFLCPVCSNRQIYWEVQQIPVKETTNKATQVSFTWTS